MKTIIIMMIIMVLFAWIMIYGITKKSDNELLFDKNDTLYLKGLWAIIIILVHIPSNQQNIIQDIIGSFAYIGVTFFFLASAYGLKYNSDKKKEYLSNFFNKRIIKIIIPMFIVNMILIMINLFVLKSYTFGVFSLINEWVLRLIFAYIVFWFFHEKKFKNNNKKADLYTSIAICMYSLLGCIPIPIFGSIFKWNVEIIGFVFGIYFYNNNNLIKSNKLSMLFSIVLSIIFGISYIKFKTIPLFGSYILRTVLSVTMNYLSFQIIKVFRLGNFINNYIGKISYELYLCHPGIILILNELFPTINSGFFIFLVLLVSIAFASIIHMIDSRLFLLLNNKERKKNYENTTCK